MKSYNLFMYIFLMYNIKTVQLKSVYANTRIVNGTIVTDIRQFPYQVSIQYNGYHFCGGTLIDEEYILTAAHCCFDEKYKILSLKKMKVVAGSAKIKKTSNTYQESSVKYIFPHGNYSHTNLSNDIALLKVTKKFKINDFVHPLNLSSYTPIEGYCLVSGWGLRSENSLVLPNDLYYANVSVIHRSNCIEVYRDSLSPTMLCAGFMSGGVDACQGDSGGPLNCGQSLVGIVSWGIGCALPNYPGVYTDVSKYLDWIKLTKESFAQQNTPILCNVLVIISILINIF